MKDFSLILNTGIQLHELEEEVIIDINEKVMKAPAFYETQIGNKITLDPVYHFPDHNAYLRRADLICEGYMNPATHEIAPEQQINENMTWIEPENIVSVNRLDVPIGDKKLPGLDQIENQWLPMPFYKRDLDALTPAPTNWCRIKLIPIDNKCTPSKRTYHIIMAFDTTENFVKDNCSPTFDGEPFKYYSLCGISQKDLSTLGRKELRRYKELVLPIKAYEYCDPSSHPWLNNYVQNMLSCTDPMRLDPGKRLKYIVYYTYFITYLHNLGVIPDVKLYNDADKASIHTNLVLDVGNSRTFGLVAEDPLDVSYSKSSIIELHDLETGEVYNNPFDMRLCFKDERFGFSSGDGQFRWPSLVRLGKEALRNIYADNQDLLSTEQFDTSHSSPKRYLWDHQPYSGQWKFVSEKDRITGQAMTVNMEGIMQQLRSDGSFTGDPKEMGEKSSYSRSSLMTFCFIEILLQVRMQINGVRFRNKNGNESLKRELSRVIITCPTAMPRQEQLTLRRCMQDAATILKRYYRNSYEHLYDAKLDKNRLEIIPAVRDLTLSGSMADMKRNWNYDEATCSQMVYLYSEMRRYLGHSEEFFSLYGRCRGKEKQPSLTIASIDIGAGTTDLMICNYKNSGTSINPTPLFWDSYHIAGDDLVKRIITEVMLDFADPKYPGASGIITEQLRAIGCRDVANTMHHFFDDTQAMGATEKRMRKEFSIQVLIPIANYLLDLLQRKESDRDLTYQDIFTELKPANCLLEFFKRQMGFDFCTIRIRYSHDFLNELVRRTFEPIFRKLAAIIYSYHCDIVLMAGRPCSLTQVTRLLRSLYPVAPNRLISMNTYRVGNWYPGSSDTGEFRDRKSMVAVGALIAYLAETGKLSMFKLNTDDLRTKVTPTTEFIGLYNAHTGTLANILTDRVNYSNIKISAFPVHLGYKQLDVTGYPAQMMYVLDFDENELRANAITSLRKTSPSLLEDDMAEDYIAGEIDNIKFRTKSCAPLQFSFERDPSEDKELVKITEIVNSDGEDVPIRRFKLSQQSWSEDESNWLDTGIFKLRLGIS